MECCVGVRQKYGGWRWPILRHYSYMNVSVIVTAIVEVCYRCTCHVVGG